MDSTTDLLASAQALIAKWPTGKNLSAEIQALEACCKKVRAGKPWKPRAPFVRPPLAICLEGGVVQSVVSTDPTAFGPVYIIDYDTDGADDGDVTMIPSIEGDESRANMGEILVEAATGIDFPEAIRRCEADEHPQPEPEPTKFFAVVKYRTRTECREWSGPVDATSMGNATDVARALVTKKRSVVRIDSISISGS